MATATLETAPAPLTLETVLEATASPFDYLAGIIADAMASKQGFKAAEVKASPFLDFLKQLLKDFLPMLLNCLPVMATDAEVLAAIKNLSLIQRVAMLRTIRQHLSMQSAVTRYALPVFAQVQAALSNVTEAHVAVARSEVQSV